MLETPKDEVAGAGWVARGDELRRDGDLLAAAEAYAAAFDVEQPSSAVCLRLARTYEQLGERGEAARWALEVADTDGDFAAWQAAAATLQRCASDSRAPLRTAKLAVLGSHTTTQLVPMIRLAARRLDVDLDVYEADYAQYRQEILDERSGLYRFAPDFVLLAVHHDELGLPDFSSSPERDVENEVDRWTSLWRMTGDRMPTTVVQTTFALPPEEPLGHLAARLPGARRTMAHAVNARLGQEAARSTNPVLLLDAERLSGLIGKDRWFDPRFWHLAKNAVAPDAMPLLARHCAALVAAALGLSKKCVVLDLDNTIWGGVVGEDGLAGIRIGEGVDGEAYAAFQDYLLALKRKGVLLAVCSKNNERDAREPFERHPDMRLRLDDLAAFVADWRPKPEQTAAVAEALSIGLNAIVYVDDNPAEREVMRQLLPEVDVVALPPDPSYYTRALASYLPLETVSLTEEDARRTEQYRARAEAADLETGTASLEDFYTSLGMQALIKPFDELDLRRVAQLVAKTNQFNLTTRRHSEAQLRQLASDPACVTLSLRLRDRFADHGLVGVAIAFVEGEVLDIDTLLLSCRVIGRTAEAAVLNRLCHEAAARGLRRLTGSYAPTAKNMPAADAYERLGFELAERHEDGASLWVYDLERHGPVANEFIDTQTWIDAS